MPSSGNAQILQCATAIVVAQISTTGTPTAEVAEFLRGIYRTMLELEERAGHEPPQPTMIDAGPAEQADAALPAIPVDQSVTHEHLVCLEDGKPLRLLKRYLMAQYGMSPDQYREKWGLPDDYPMIAPALAEQRRAAARKTGLGKKRQARTGAPRAK